MRNLIVIVLMGSTQMVKVIARPVAYYVLLVTMIKTIV